MLRPKKDSTSQIPICSKFLLTQFQFTSLLFPQFSIVLPNLHPIKVKKKKNPGLTHFPSSQLELTNSFHFILFRMKIVIARRRHFLPPSFTLNFLYTQFLMGYSPIVEYSHSFQFSLPMKSPPIPLRAHLSLFNLKFISPNPPTFCLFPPFRLSLASNCPKRILLCIYFA